MSIERGDDGVIDYRLNMLLKSHDRVLQLNMDLPYITKVTRKNRDGFRPAIQRARNTVKSFCEEPPLYLLRTLHQRYKSLLKLYPVTACQLATFPQQKLLGILDSTHRYTNGTRTMLQQKIKEQEELLDKINQTYGSSIRSHIPVALESTILRINHKKDHLDVFFGGLNNDPLGPGHGHYIIRKKSGEMWVMYSRDPLERKV